MHQSAFMCFLRVFGQQLTLWHRRLNHTVATQNVLAGRINELLVRVSSGDLLIIKRFKNVSFILLLFFMVYYLRKELQQSPAVCVHTHKYYPSSAQFCVLSGY